MSTCLLAKFFAKFSRSFCEVFEVFANFRRSSEVLGQVWTCLDLFGCIGMRLDAFGYSLGISEKLDLFLDFWLHFWMFLSFFVSSDGYFSNIRYVFQRLRTFLNGWRQVLETAITLFGRFRTVFGLLRTVSDGFGPFSDRFGP